MKRAFPKITKRTEVDIALPPMPLSEALKLHDLYKPEGSLKNNLGDGFLCFYNPMYRNIRELFLGCGFQYTEEDFCFYGTFPLAALSSMHARGRVVLRDNCTILRTLESEKPGTFTLRDFPDFAQNRLLHESSHIIGHQLFPFTRLSSSPTLNDERKMVLNGCVQEAFASTNELVANIFCQSKMHRNFFKMNSYVLPGFNEILAVIHGIDLFGFQTTYRLIQLSYASAYFWPFSQRLKVSELRQIYENIFGKPMKRFELQIADQITQLGWLLNNSQFRQITNSFYFKKLGMKTEFKKVVDFNFISLLLENEECLLRFNAMADFAEYGVHSKSFMNLKQSKPLVKIAS